MVAVLRVGGTPAHEHRACIGFREARFAEDGFFLNGRRLTVFGLNRHQLYPYAGIAMPDRVQRRDARILCEEFNCTMGALLALPAVTGVPGRVRRAGDAGLREDAGWQYLGDDAWKDLVVADVEQMIRRDRNRPSVVVWGVRVNESANDTALYTRTRDLAGKLDPGQPTTGAMVGGRYSTTGFLQDVFSYNDYTYTDRVAALRSPLPGIPYLVTGGPGAGAMICSNCDRLEIEVHASSLEIQSDTRGTDSNRALSWEPVSRMTVTGDDELCRLARHAVPGRFGRTVMCSSRFERRR